MATVNHADLIITNAKVYAGDSENKWAEALQVASKETIRGIWRFKVVPKDSATSLPRSPSRDLPKRGTKRSWPGLSYSRTYGLLVS